jgi:cysteinyl-tRNA synthetase
MAHLGHARTYINTDIIRRILTNYFHYQINFAMGMTDIDDKIIHRAQERGTNWKKLAREYEQSFLSDMDALNVKRPQTILRVTEHIPDIIQYIQQILVTGRAYETETGVYFDVKNNLSSYGKLGNIPTGEEEEGGGMVRGKKDSRDFALWKAVDPASGTPHWDSPWGPGRPGWHIECSAMSHAYFGPTVDIHSGGIDLRFPHHTNEIAQRSLLASPLTLSSLTLVRLTTAPVTG